jgi:hypothetical protein
VIVRCVRIFQNYSATKPELDADPNGLIRVGDEFEVRAIVADRNHRQFGIELPEENRVMCSIEMFVVIDQTIPSDWQATIEHGSALVIQPPGAETRLTQEGNYYLWGEPTAVWKRAQGGDRRSEDS